MFYTYCSFEPWGRSYIGYSHCDGDPMDHPYLGSYHDKTFNPTEKVIISFHETREEALEAEIALHDFFDVAEKPSLC